MTKLGHKECPGPHFHIPLASLFLDFLIINVANSNQVIMLLSLPTLRVIV